MSAPGNTNLFQGNDGHWRDTWCLLALPGLLDSMLYKLDMQDSTKMTSELAKKKRWNSTSDFLFHESLLDILQDTEKSYWQTSDIGKTVFQISCLMEKSARHYGSVGWRWILNATKELSLGDYSGSKISLSILKFWKLLTMYLLFY